MKNRQNFPNGKPSHAVMARYLVIAAAVLGMTVLAIPAKASAFEVFGNYWAPRINVSGMSPGLTEIAAAAPAATHDAKSDAVKLTSSASTRLENDVAKKVAGVKETALKANNVIVAESRRPTTTAPVK